MSEEFKDLFNSQPEVKVGDVVEAIVEQVDSSKGQLVVSLPGGVQGAVPARELSTTHAEDISELAKVGDKLELLVAKEVKGNAQDDGITFILSKVKLAARAAWKELEGKEGEVINVTVTNVVKGGLSVDAKGVRGFIPASMVDDHYVSDFSQYKGQSFDAKIIEVDPTQNRLILSRRAVIEAEKAEAKERILATIHEGDVVEGVVARLTDFGAFVNLGGLDGLVHVSEIAHHRVNKPSDVLSVGDKIKVQVLRINPEDARISLSLKATIPGPWADIEEKAPVGAELDGTVKRLTTFGAFVEVFPGVEGLVHISQISHKHIATPQEVLSEGEQVRVKVLELNPADHRIGLSIKALEEAPVVEKVEVTPAEEAYVLPEEETGFSLGEIAGLDELKED
ncbi:MAG: 30S ribosomal protein S1 [Lactobacillales bacterium]|jgi:small subunit ribosomal protein S1|nr:30S ribosomal protein S1 [Lactobacillales bacterium]